MSAGHAVRSWHGSVYRHIPADSLFGPLDTRFARRSRENHWNRDGEPTLYFVTDRAMLRDEFARHIGQHRAPELAAHVRTRRIFEIALELERVYDLTNPEAIAHLGIANAPACFLDRAVARATAGFLRDAIGVEGIIVPAIAQLHRPGRRFVVLFPDRIERPLSDIARHIEPVGSLQFGSSSIAQERALSTSPSTTP